MQNKESIIRLADDNIGELIKEHRNGLIGELLKPAGLKNYLAVRYKKDEVSIIKIEFIMKALKELSDSKIDLSLYAPVFLEIQKSSELILSSKNEEPFHEDIRSAIETLL